MRLPLSSPPRHNLLKELIALLILGLFITGALLLGMYLAEDDAEPVLAPAMFNQPAYEIPVLGGIGVPSGLRCQEDELIGFLGPDTVGCLHNEILDAESQHRASER